MEDIHDARSGACDILRGASDPCHRERAHDQRLARTDEDHREGDAERIARGEPHPPAEGEPSRIEHAACHEHPGIREALREGRDRKRHRELGEGERQEGDGRDERREVGDLLHRGRHQEEVRYRGPHHKEASEIGRGALSTRKEAERHERQLGAQLDDHEERQRSYSEGKRSLAEGHSVDSVDQAAEGDDGKGGTKPVDRAALLGAFRHEAQRQNDQEDAEGKIDVEAVAPGGIGRDDAACDHAEGGADASDGTVIGNGAVALLPFIGVDQERQRRGREHRGADALDDTHADDHWP